MDLFSLGTPVVDLFAKSDDATIRKLKLEKGATNHMSASRLAAIERQLGKKITYRYAGDNARNVCEGVAALGGFAGYSGATGEDKSGAYFAANLEECGIANFLEERQGSTGKILVLVTKDGQRTFCADLGVSTECKGFEKMALANSKMFFVSSITLVSDGNVARLAEKYLDEAKKLKKRIAISLESPPMVAMHRERLLATVKKYADILFLNEEEAGALLGDEFWKRLAGLKSSSLVYLKKGRNGSVVFSKGKRHAIAAMEANAIDTTGAGDSYAAGVLYGLARGYSPVGSGKIGCMLATKVVEKFGAGIPFGHVRMRILHKIGK